MQSVRRLRARTDGIVRHMGQADRGAPASKWAARDGVVVRARASKQLAEAIRPGRAHEGPGYPSRQARLYAVRRGRHGETAPGLGGHGFSKAGGAAAPGWWAVTPKTRWQRKDRGAGADN
jgi:hypothetical protein